MKFRHFSDISSFPKVLSFKSFGNSYVSCSGESADETYLINHEKLITFLLNLITIFFLKSVEAFSFTISQKNLPVHYRNP